MTTPRPAPAEPQFEPRFEFVPALPGVGMRVDPLRLAVAAYLARYKGTSRVHAESDLRAWLAWSAERQLEPLAARRVHIELYVRWMQEVRRFKPSTVSRRLAVLAGFYRTCVIDDVLDTPQPSTSAAPPSPPSPRPSA